MTAKHWLILSLVLAVLGIVFFTGYHFRKAQAWEETVRGKDARIEELQSQIEESTKAGETQLVEAEEPQEKADALEPIIIKGRADLARARKAAIRAEDEVLLLRGQNKLLEEALRLRNEELSAKNAALNFFRLSLDQNEERSKLQEEKYTALKRSKKAEKRKRIGVLILSHASVAGVMYGFGRIN